MSEILLECCEDTVESAGSSSSRVEPATCRRSSLVTEALPAIIVTLEAKPPVPDWSTMNKTTLKTRLNGKITFLFLIPVLLCGPQAAIGEETASPGPNIQLRRNFLNSYYSFSAGKKGHVAFIGGSITEMNGYRPMLCNFLKKRFPATEFTFTNAGISSTCSTTGAFRLQRDVLAKGPVDLFFIEYAVNDDQDAAHARRECIRAMEGILRQVHAHNPMADIVITHFVNPGMLKTVGKGKEPVSSGSHEDVAKHYGVSTIHLAREVDRLIAAGELTWRKFGGTHPGPHGNRLCADMIEKLLTTSWNMPAAGKTARVAHTLPKKPLDPGNYGAGHFLDPASAEIKAGWKNHIPAWKKIGGGFRGRFGGRKLLCATAPGAECTLEFTGRAIGAYILAGPDAGTVEASIDGGPFKSYDLYHRYSRGLHYPRTVMFFTDLAAGKHTLSLRTSERKARPNAGHAARILQFTVN